MTTRYEEQYYNDIHRIANTLEKLAKNLENPLSNQEHQIISGHINSDIKPLAICPYCGSNNVQCMFSETIDGCCVSGHYLCKDCHEEFNV